MRKLSFISFPPRKEMETSNTTITKPSLLLLLLLSDSKFESSSSSSSSSHGSVVDDGGTARKFVPDLLTGGIAAAVSETCTAPLARLTILFQVQGMHSDVATLSKPCIWRAASHVMREEGLRALWKGNLATIAHRLPCSSINAYAYERYKKLLWTAPGLESHRGNVTENICVRLVAGGLAGITAASASYPLDLVRTRLSTQTSLNYYKGIWHTLHSISREEGIFGLYKGLGAGLLAVGTTTAISFAAHDTLSSYWKSQRPHDSTVLVSLACGSLSGITSATATFPFDLVRRRLQLEGADGHARVYTTGLFGIFRHIFRTGGLHSLYRGIVAEYYKVIPSAGIFFMTLETMKVLPSEIPTDVASLNPSSFKEESDEALTQLLT